MSGRRDVHVTGAPSSARRTASLPTASSLAASSLGTRPARESDVDHDHGSNGASHNRTRVHHPAFGTNGFIPTPRLLRRPSRGGRLHASNAAVTMNLFGAVHRRLGSLQDNDQVETQPEWSIVTASTIASTTRCTPKTQVDEQPTRSLRRWIRRPFLRWAQSALYTAISWLLGEHGLGRDFTITWTQRVEHDDPRDSRKHPRPPSIKTRTASGCDRSIRRRPAPDESGHVDGVAVNDHDRGRATKLEVAMTVNGRVHRGPGSGNGTGDDKGVFVKIFKSKWTIDGRRLRTHWLLPRPAARSI